MRLLVSKYAKVLFILQGSWHSKTRFPVGFSILYHGDSLPHQEGIPYPPSGDTLGISVDSTIGTVTSTYREGEWVDSRNL